MGSNKDLLADLKMDSGYRRCYACEHKHSGSHDTHPYLKRSSLSKSVSRTCPPSPAVTSSGSISSTPVPSASEDNIWADFPTIDQFMSEARVKYAANPEKFMREARAKRTNHPEYLPTPEPDNTHTLTAEEMDLDARIDAAIFKSSALIAEATAQLNAACVAPEELTPSEQAEKEANEKWDANYRKADALTDQMLEKNDKLFDEVMGLIDEVEAANIAIPDNVKVPDAPASPKIESLRAVPTEVRDYVSDSKKPFEESRNGEVNLAPIQRSSSINASTQTETNARSLPRKPASSVPTQTDKTAKTDRPRTQQKVNANSNTSALKSNEGWHTLWSCDYKASWGRK